MPHRLRRTAAFLASLALLAVPARSVLACEMEATTQANVVSVHSGHDMSASAEVDLESPSERPHPTCDHLVGCAPLALANGRIDLPALAPTSAPAVPFVDRGTQSPARALEPPPPKR